MMDAYMEGGELTPAEGRAGMSGKSRRKCLCGWKDLTLVIIVGKQGNGCEGNVSLLPAMCHALSYLILITILGLRIVEA